MFLLFLRSRKRASALLLAVVSCFLFSRVDVVQAAITFQDDSFHEIPSEAILIDSDGAGASDTSIQFGNDGTAAQNGVLEWDIAADEFQLTNGDLGSERANLSFEAETVAALPGGAPGLGATGTGRFVELTATDSVAPGCTVVPNCPAGPYIWDSSTWIPMTGGGTASALTKVVTVGSTGADYTTIDPAAAYLQTRSGGIMLLSAETHVVTTAIDLTNVIMVGKDATRTIVQISGSGQFDTFDTTFEFLTLDVNAITDDMAIDVQTGASSLIFNFVDFDVQDGGDSLVDSNAGAAPTVTMKFIKSNDAGGSGTILKTVAGGNLNVASSIFVDSRSGDSPLEMSDWALVLSGGGSVNTTGTITSVPAQSIFVSPNMNLQGAIDSLETAGSGGLITLLPGTHAITTTLTIEDSNIQIVGYGDTSLISASGITSGDTVGAIQVGAANGSAPVNGTVLKDFKLEVTGTGGTDVHGIRIAGGEDNRVDNVTVQKISGSSGSGGSARIGIQLIDGAGGCTGTCVLTRPVVINSRVFGNGGSNYFTDGIHVSSDGDITGIFGNDQGVVNALLDGNNVDRVAETAYVFAGVNNSSLFNNRATSMGASGGGAYGIFMTNISNINMNANVFSGSLSTSAIGIGIESFNTGGLKETVDSIFNGNIIDGFGNSGVGFATGFQIGNTTNTGVHRNAFQNNTIRGAIAGTSVAIVLRGDADENTFSFNNISGGTNPWDDGVDIQAAAAAMNFVLSNRYDNVTTTLTDNGTDSMLATDHHRAAVAPTVNEDSNDGYDIGAVWVDTATDTAYMLMDATVGAAVWDQIDAGGVATSLDAAYNNGNTITVDAGGGDLIFNLSNTEDFIIQDGGVAFATFTDTGDFNLTNNLTVGATTETITSDGGFFNLDGDDLYVDGELGAKAGIATDDTQIKYLPIDLEGCKRGGTNNGNKISGNVPVIRFDADNTDQIRCTFPIPDDYQTGTNVVVTMFWSPSNTDTGNVRWLIDEASVPGTEVLDGSDFTQTPVLEAAGGTTDQLQSESFSLTGEAANEVVFLRIRRTGGDAADTFTGFVDMSVLRIEYTGKKLR